MLTQYVALPKEVQSEMTWLISPREEIYKWEEWVRVTRDVIRREGFYDGVDEVIMDKLIEMKLTAEGSEEFAEELIDYVCSEGDGIRKNNRLIGTTEAPEGG